MAGVVVAALLASAPAVAGAATAKVRNGTLTYSAAAGEANVLSVKFASGAFVLSDSGALITPGTGCAARAPAHLVTCRDVDRIEAALGDGADELNVDASVPLGVTAVGGAGDDVLRGGPQADTLSGGPGADRLDGAAGPDVLRGGDDLDTADYSTRTQAVAVALDAVAGDGEAGEGDLVDSTTENVTGGAGPDVLAGDTHAHRLLGGGGDDTLQGMRGADVLDGGGGVNSASYRERTDRVVASLDDVVNDGAPGEQDVLSRVQNLVGGAGPDTLTGSANANRLDGGPGADRLDALGGPDVVRGGIGDDVVLLGTGNDTFDWMPGDSSDVVDGQGDNDTLRFSGANIGERFDLSANGGRLRLTRDVATVSMDVGGVENVDLRAVGGADAIAVHDLAGTNVSSVRLDLAASGTTAGDGDADTATVEGTQGDDVATVTGDASGVGVAGLSSRVSIVGQEAALDTLVVQLLAGDDVLDASGLTATGIGLSGAGGDGDDVLIGSAGADRLFGEAGDDVLIGGPGPDALDGGPGDNVVLQD
jgi:Ca2+-binding RTX toxin-like protein